MGFSFLVSNLVIYSHHFNHTIAIPVSIDGIVPVKDQVPGRTQDTVVRFASLS